MHSYCFAVVFNDNDESAHGYVIQSHDKRVAHQALERQIKEDVESGYYDDEAPEGKPVVVTSIELQHIGPPGRTK